MQAWYELAGSLEPFALLYVELHDRIAPWARRLFLHYLMEFKVCHENFGLKFELAFSFFLFLRDILVSLTEGYNNSRSSNHENGFICSRTAAST